MELVRFLPFFAAGLAAVIGIFFYLYNHMRLRRWRPVVGKVVGSQAMYAHGATRFAPEIRFTTSDGRAITFVSQYGLISAPIPATPVDVLYNPKDPARAELKHNIATQHAPLVCAICAVVFSLGGLAVVFR